MSHRHLRSTNDRTLTTRARAGRDLAAKRSGLAASLARALGTALAKLSRN